MPSGKKEDMAFHVQRAKGLLWFCSEVQGLSIAFRNTSGGQCPCGRLGGCAMGYLTPDTASTSDVVFLQFAPMHHSSQLTNLPNQEGSLCWAP